MPEVAADVTQRVRVILLYQRPDHISEVLWPGAACSQREVHLQPGEGFGRLNPLTGHKPARYSAGIAITENIFLFQLCSSRDEAGLPYSRGV